MEEKRNKISEVNGDRVVQRFLSKFKMTESCWLWTGAVQSQGYGCIGQNGKIFLAHRLSFELYYGQIPSGMLVLHHCDNRLCVNPNHLFLGSNLDNMEDMVEKNRQAKGDKNGKTKLGINQVNQIRALYQSGDYSYRQLALEFGISKRHVGSIVKGECWKFPLAV